MNHKQPMNDKRFVAGMVHRLASCVLYPTMLSCALITGCQSSAKELSEGFVADEQPRYLDYLNASQSATGARDDAMLYARHFDGPVLNELGKAKVHLILRKAPVEQPPVIYLALKPEDPLAAERRSALEEHLRKQQEIMAANYEPVLEPEVRLGINDATYHLASYDLIRLPKTESGSLSTAGAAPAASPAAPSAPPASNGGSASAK